MINFIETYITVFDCLTIFWVFCIIALILAYMFDTSVWDCYDDLVPDEVQGFIVIYFCMFMFFLGMFALVSWEHRAYLYVVNFVVSGVIGAVVFIAGCFATVICTREHIQEQKRKSK